VSVALALAAWLGCARGEMPPELIGRWTSDDPRYAERSLEIDRERLVFGVGGGLRMAYRVQGVESEADPEAGTLYLVFYDAPGEPERTLQLRLPDPGQLQLENNAARWTRAAGG
jgi:hypothetical protein